MLWRACLTACLVVWSTTLSAQTVDRLIDSLADPDKTHWARDNLRDRGKEAFPHLVHHLKTDPRPEVRRGCAFVLGKLRDDKAAGPLSMALADPKPIVREAAAAALAELAPPEAAPVLMRAVREDTVAVRAAVVRALGEIEALADHSSPAIRRVLVAHLADAAPEVRTRAVVALARRRHDDNVPLLAWVIEHDRREEIRFLAVQYLADTKHPGVPGLLVALLGDDSAMVRRRAVSNLRVMAGRQEGFDPDKPAAAQPRPLARWQAWVASKQPDPPRPVVPRSPARQILGFEMPTGKPGSPGIVDLSTLRVSVPPVVVRLNALQEEKAPAKFVEAFEAGCRALVAGKPAGARRHFDAAADLDNRSAPLHVNLALAWLALDKPGLAEQHLRYALKLDPNNDPAMVNLAITLRRRGQTDAALAALADALKANPTSPRLLTTRAWLLLEANRHDAAADYVEALLHKDIAAAHPTPGTLLKLALAVQARRGRYGHVDSMLALWKRDGARAEEGLLLAEVLRRVGKVERALLVLAGLAESDDKAVAMRASSAMLGLAWREGAGVDDTVVTRHRKTHPEDPLGWWLGAWLLLHRPPLEVDPEAALALARKAVDLAPHDPAAEAVLVVALQAASDKEASRKRLTEALKRHPDDPLMRELARLYVD